MPAAALALALLIMSASYFSPGFALSSRFDSDGVPLSELSWSSSLTVVAVSFSGLFTFIFLMLACLCCKKGEIGFKEFENAEGDEYQADMSTLASPVSASSPDVYILPLSEVSLPVAKQPSRSVQLQKSTDASQHSLLYIKEIGRGWFGKVLLGEVTSGLTSTQVVVKELKTSASIQDQMHFLEEAQPYRSLQHPALVQCLAQCTDVTPYLLIMEFCPLGDVKGYLRSCRAADSVTPDLLLLQRMACQIASGLLHLHKYDYRHSDLALRNCLLTSDANVKIGDYGLAHSKYKDDYFLTSDQSWVPLRWIAPELVDEVHGNILMGDQTKQSNIWSFGVTIWELFELGNQPYRHYSDRQVLSFAVKDQQLKLPKPTLQFSLSDRWYEVMQFCWLQPDQRPNAEEVHLLLSYLCAKGASEAEEDFERRWNSMRPNMIPGSLNGAGPLTLEIPQSLTSSSSFPLLEQFSAGDGYQSESGDDILTVTETSHGLNFEYKWEQARAKQHYTSSSTTGTLGQGNPHCQEVYYPPGGMVGGCGIDGLTLGVSTQYYDPKQLHTPSVVPVLSAHSPSVNSEYYIRIEEPVECNIDMEYTICGNSPEFGDSNGSFFTASGDSGDCINCPSKSKTIESYWSADIHKSSAYDSDSSPTMSLTMEPLLGQVSNSSPRRPWESGHYVSYKDRDGGYYYENSPSLGMDHYLIGGQSEPMRESWGSRSLRQALGELEEPLGISNSLRSSLQDYADPYLERSQGSVLGKNISGGYYDMMGSLRKIMPGNHPVCIDIESGAAVFVGQDESDSEEEEDLFIERQAMGWSTNHSTNRKLSLSQRQSSTQDTYADFHYTMPMTNIEDAWPENHSLPYNSKKTIKYLEGRAKSNTCPVHGRQASVSSADCSTYIHLCHEPREAEVYPVPCCQALSNSHFVDPLTGSIVRNSFMNDNISDQNKGIANRNPQVGQAALPTEQFISKSESVKDNLKQIEHPEYVGTGVKKSQGSTEQQDSSQIDIKTEVLTITQQMEKPFHDSLSNESESDRSRMVDSGVEHGHSRTSLVETDNCSDDDDITDVTSGIFADFTGDFDETVDYTATSFKSLQKQVGTPDSMDSIDLPSTAGSSETLSSTSLHPSTSPRTVDSGYDTENNESPEFVLKEPHEPQDTKNFIQPLGLSVTDSSSIVEVKEGAAANIQQEDIEDVEKEVTIKTSQSTEKLTVLSEKTPYRDSAYFSDTDAGKEKECDEDRKKDINELEMKEEETIQETYQKTLPSLVEEQEQVKSNALETEEKSEDAFNDIQERTQTALRTGQNGQVSSSSSEPTVISSISPEAHEGCINNTVLDEALKLNSNDPQEVHSDNQLSDLNPLTFSDAKQANHKPEQLDPILSIETSAATSIVKDRYAEASLDCIISTTEPNQEELVIEEATSSTSPEERSTQDNNNVEILISDSAQSVLTENIIDKSETPADNSLNGVQFHKSSTRPSSPPPLPSLEGRVPKVERGETDDEDRDSEDSDESDEELRTYSIHEQSEESEDEMMPVPIIVSDCSDAHKLRSLLKMPSVCIGDFGDESKKKVVSFFEDVTVYMFDEGSPTGDLSEHAYPLGCKTSTQGARCTLLAVQQEKANSTDDSSDGNVSEESTGFEWDDDFSLLPLPTSPRDSSPDIKAKPKPSVPPSATNEKPVVRLSRFTVSPSPISRFSTTHISDSDMDSAGGSSEDGDRE